MNEIDHEFDATAYFKKSAEIAPTTQAIVSRQAQEVQMAMFVAKQYPRDSYKAFEAIMTACERLKLAAAALYEYPRGGQKVTGPSIRLAETLAQNWGNIDFGVIELEQRKGESQVMAYAWDLQTNTRQTKVFAVKHERKAKGAVVRLDDPRDIYEMVANQGARRVRACILGVIPGDIIEAAIQKCEHTLTTGHKEPLEDRVRKMLSVFKSEHGVTQEMIEKYAQCNVESFSEHNMLALIKVYQSLKDGMSKREDYFDIRQGKSTDMISGTEAAFAKAKQGNKGGKEDGTDGEELLFE